MWWRTKNDKYQVWLVGFEGKVIETDNDDCGKNDKYWITNDLFCPIALTVTQFIDDFLKSTKFWSFINFTFWLEALCPHCLEYVGKDDNASRMWYSGWCEKQVVMMIGGVKGTKLSLADVRDWGRSPPYPLLSGDEHEILWCLHNLLQWPLASDCYLLFVFDKMYMVS